MADIIDIRRIGDWKLADRILRTASSDLGKAIDEALDQEGEFFVGKIKQYMRTGAFAPLSPNTLAVMGGGGGRDTRGRFKAGRGGHGGKPLFRSGDLRNSVTKVKAGAGAIFIGVPRNAPSKAGRPLVNIADVHERGATIVLRMTPAMRRFLFARLPKQIGPRLPGGHFYSKSTGIIVIKIPARPFIAPVFAEFGPTTHERFLARLAKRLDARGVPTTPM